MTFDENFTEDEVNILKRYATNTNSNVFILKNLPEVIKGALFSRYSRSKLGLRSLLLKEFIQDDKFSLLKKNMQEVESDEEMLEVEKAKNFYNKILDGFGDDSIGELGGAHLAFENVSMIAAKAIEDCRIGGSPLEKSTRYICFDQKVNDDYLFYKEPILLTSAFKDIYPSTCRLLFDTYSRLIPLVSELIEKKFPKQDGMSTGAYNAALRAKTLDCLRGLLPASALTNLGVFGNGRFFENLIKKLNSHNLSEFQEIGKKAYDELYKVMPSFVQRTEPSNEYQISYFNFIEQTRNNLKILASTHSNIMKANESKKDVQYGVNLIKCDPDSVYDVCASLLFEFSDENLLNLQKYCRTLPSEEIVRIFEAVSSTRTNRRHKSPRALENAAFTFEIIADFGIYRDLQRHRMLTQERKLLTCNFGYYIPDEIMETDMEIEYENAMEQARITYDMIAKQFPEEAQYVVPMAYNMHWYFTVNLRSLQWLCELRSSAAGHPSYRFVAHKMAKEVCDKIPQFECFFKFVDFDGYDLGRLSQEERRLEKIKMR